MSIRRRVVIGSVAVAPWLSGAPAPPPVYLNHFYVVVDAASYRALQESSFARDEWAPFEQRTTRRNDQTYTGAYWYGRHTYYEVFEPEAQGPVGASGLALGVEAAGQAQAVQATWNEALGGASSGTVTRRTETAEPAWFDMTHASAPPGVLRIWLMEYARDFLANWYPQLTPARGITRAEVLDRYVAKIGRSAERGHALLRDVTGLMIALESGERDTLVKHLRPLGWRVRHKDGSTLIAGPEGVELRVIEPIGGQRGILEATFSLQRRAQPRTERFGATVLTIEPNRARLRFGR